MKVSLFLFLSLVYLSVYSQVKDNSNIYPIGFYNVENLYHPHSTDPLHDKDFTENGIKKWTIDKYYKKITNISYTISRIAEEYGNPVIMGFAEVGDRTVLEDISNHKFLEKNSYKVIHYNSPDRRGIDVGLIYNSQIFTVLTSKPYPYIIPKNKNFKTRDILLVKGILNNEILHILVNHWPSRYGGTSGELRERAAYIVKNITDSIQKTDSKAKIIIMGDFNDDPPDISLREILKARKSKMNIKNNELYNPMWELLEKWNGSSAYQGKWNIFDQIIISGSLINTNKNELTFLKAAVFKESFLLIDSGKSKGYPLRTFNGNIFINGYSDHLPVLIYLQKTKR